jgi:hypothetical protein
MKRNSIAGIGVGVAPGVAIGLALESVAVGIGLGVSRWALPVRSRTKTRRGERAPSKWRYSLRPPIWLTSRRIDFGLQFRGSLSIQSGNVTKTPD